MNDMSFTATPAAVAIRGLSKTYRGQAALDGLTLDVPKGSLTVLLGAAGAGKTTTLRLLAGLEVPDDGTILIGGRDCAGLEPKDRDLAMIFDNLALYPNLTGAENIAHPLRIRRVPAAAIDEKVTAVAATLRIPHVLKRKPKTMSGGERQRVALGRALVRDPAVFLLDEPLSSLDALLRIELRAELKRLQREEGHTFLLATPDFAEAMAIADTVVMLRNGRVVQIADPQSLYDRPADRETARFVGAPEINLLPARFEPGGGGRILLADGTMAAPEGFGGIDAFDFEAGIRPEYIRPVTPGTGDLAATVTDIEPLGHNAAVTVDSGGTELRLVVPIGRAAALPPGTALGLTVEGRRILAFSPADGTRLFPHEDRP